MKFGKTRPKAKFTKKVSHRSKSYDKKGLINKSKGKSRTSLSDADRKHAEAMADKFYKNESEIRQFKTDNAKEITKRKLGKQGATTGTAVGVSATQNVSEIVDGGVGDDSGRDADKPKPRPRPVPGPHPNPEPNPTDPWEPIYDPKG